MSQFDNNFLNSLFSAQEREVHARITALNFQEKPLEFIEGKVTGGSINIDGQSAVRRTCSLSLIAKDVEIHDFYWGLKNKFKLEIGLKNKIDSRYPEIIWFKQGIYIITSFNTTINNNSFNISISGKDKMCLLNGDISGALPHTTDFGIEEYHDANDNITYKSIPIRRILYESIQSFGNELPNNIIINDIEDYGMDLLEYRGNIPLYFFKSVREDTIQQMTVNGKQSCYINGNFVESTIDSIINYDTLIRIDENINYQPDIITLSQEANAIQYTVIKLEYGMNAGYRLTDLVYAGDLILNVGEPLTSLYDKIKNMLGDFEYFYNVDGKFVFQKKRFYINTPWNSNTKSDEQISNELALYNNTATFNLLDNFLVTNIQNTPNLLNLKNDFSVWGTKKNSSGSELPIHMRYAIDIKPTYYKNFNNEIYTIEDYDWRELIYQMALDYRKHYFSNDDFFYTIMNNNPQYATGKTGYEQYYIDLEGFWRQLYDPNPPAEYESIKYNKEDFESNKIYVETSYETLSIDSIPTDISKFNTLYVIDNESKSIIPFLKGKCKLKAGETYYFKNTSNQWTHSDVKSELESIEITKIYIQNQDGSIENFAQKFLNELIDDNVILYKLTNKSKMLYNNLTEEEKNIYNQEQIKVYKITDYNNFGEEIVSGDKNIKNSFFKQYYNYYLAADNDNLKYWNKNIINNPENLIFWFDFLDAESSDLSKYAVSYIGSRAKVVNDKDVKIIQYRKIPNVLFKSVEQEDKENYPGYTIIQLQSGMENLFTISSKGKSCKERIDELLSQHSYCAETINITTLPIYSLEPNIKLLIKNNKNFINGKYMINKLSIPLTYNGTMTIGAFRVIDDIM